MATYKQLTAQLEKLQVQVEEARGREVEAAIAQIKEKIAEYDITAEELGFASPSPGAGRRKSALPPKYRNPKTGETWSGRGRVPRWIGKHRERFLIEG
jgi:DNA-binding protein H-NS